MSREFKAVVMGKQYGQVSLIVPLDAAAMLELGDHVYIVVPESRASKNEGETR